MADGNGRAGYERGYDGYEHLTMERWIGIDGKPIPNSVGYAEYRREYSGSNLISESYYDSDGRLVNRIDGYAKAVLKILKRMHLSIVVRLMI